MQFSLVASVSAFSPLSHVFRRMARATDRAIRRLEDRHRGELPYMRRMRDEPDTCPVDLAQTLSDSEAAARTAECAALTALWSLANPPCSVAAADQLKALADQAAQTAGAYYSLQAEIVDQPAIMRGEPVWACGLAARFAALAGACSLTPLPARTVRQRRPRRP